MSRETEKVFKQMQKYIEQNKSENMDEDGMSAMIDDFMQKYNDSMMVGITEETVRTAEDFLELAENADNEGSALKYAKKALKLDPDNLDAEYMIAVISARNQIDLLDKLRNALLHGEKVMKEKGYADEDSIGYYWGITETRPFMRLKMEYMSALKDNGMLRKAIMECEDMIRLNENDNQGVRYTLMHLYAFMEDEQKALELHKKYDSYEETQMLFPLSVLYFKLGDMEKSFHYLKRLSAANKDTKKFLRAVINNNLQRYADELSDFGYQPFTIQEFLIELLENRELFDIVPGYFHWAAERLKSKKS